MDHPSMISVEYQNWHNDDGSNSATLHVEEYQPIDRAAYQWESGWSCWDETTDEEFFVSMSGVVYLQPDNNVVGIAPEIKKAADAMEASYTND